MSLGTVFYQFKADYTAGKMSPRLQNKLGLKRPKYCKPNIAICFKIKFIHKDIEVMNF